MEECRTVVNNFCNGRDDRELARERHNSVGGRQGWGDGQSSGAESYKEFEKSAMMWRMVSEAGATANRERGEERRDEQKGNPFSSSPVSGTVLNK